MEIKICTCGKCKVTCYKHGKRAKCEECGKVRILGTQRINNKLRFICNKCIEAINKKTQDELDEQIKILCDEVRAQGDKDVSLKKLRIRKEEDERCTTSEFTGEKYAWT